MDQVGARNDDCAGDRWIGTIEAAALLSRNRATVSRLVVNGDLQSSRRVGQRLEVRRDEVEALVRARDRWVSYVDAATIIGCAVATVTKLVQDGRFEQRGAGTNAIPSLGRRSVERVAQERAAAAAERAARAAARPTEQPPDDGYEWIGPTAAGKMLGVTESSARWMAREDKVPAVRRGRRWWFRRDQVLLVANARAARGLQA